MHKALIVLVILFVSLSVRAENYSEQPLAQEFVDEMVEKHGFERAYLEGLMTEATRKDRILEAIARPAEKTKEWKDYRKIFIQQSRIRKGREFMQTYADTLARAEQEFGVPPKIVTAIIGVETRYGSNKGSYRVVDSLSTLAFDYPKRSKFFRGQLEQYLLLVREQEFDPLAIKGSYAGAMGYGQFIPSSYRDFAVDFDGDGIADIINNPVDAIGSVANYFSKHGWKKGELVVVQATAGKGHDAALIDKKLKPKYTVGQLAYAGFTPYQPLQKDAAATIMGLQGDEGMEYWIGLKNFYVITRYNHSRLYGMAVFQLSESF
jgi:membrane-bound lytic murein transglycosylase B